MDMNTRNSRQKQEDGVFVPLCDQWTGEAIKTGKGAPGFLVRGIAARSTQMRLAEAQLAAKQAAQAVADGKGEAESADAYFDQVHKATIETAMKYIIEPRNMTLGDEPVTTPDHMREILNMTFPDFQVEKDDKGASVTTTVSIKDKDGKPIDVQTPKLTVVGKTFAQQVIEAAENQQGFLDKQPTG